MFDDFITAFSSPVQQISISFPWFNRVLGLLGMVQFRVFISRILTFVEEAVGKHQATFQPDSERDFIDSYLGQIERTHTDPKSSFHRTKGKLNLSNVLLDLFLAGSETTSTVLNWATLYMANHQEVQRKVQDEIEKACGKSGSPVYADRLKTPYTEAVTLELLRISNVVPPGFPHYTIQDVHFRGYIIPKGTQVFASLGTVMEDPANFPEPDEFKPERFYDAASNTFVPSQLVIPFSLGKRRCPGEQLARVELYMFLTGILQRFTVLPETDGVVISTDHNEGYVRSPLPYKVRFVSRS